MATISYSLSAKPDKASGKHRIYLRFCYGAKGAQRAKTQYYIKPEFWEQETQSVKMPRVQMKTDAYRQTLEDLTRIQIILPQLSSFIIKEYEAAKETELSANWLKEVLEDFVPAGEKKAPSAVKVYGADMIATMRDFVEKRDIVKGTLSMYVNTIDAFERFIVYSGREINFRNVTSDDMEDFRFFLINEHKLAEIKTIEREGERQRDGVLPGGDIVFYDQRYKETLETLGKSIPSYRGRSLNTIFGYMQRLSALFGEAVRRGYLSANPMKDVKVDKLMYVKHPIFLTMEEREHLFDFDFSAYPELEAHRDIFIFQSSVACRYGDLCRFKKSSIVDGVLRFIPQKTKRHGADVLEVPLDDYALEIVEKYKDLEGERLLPFVTMGVHNRSLKKVFQMAGLDRIVTILDPMTREEKRVPLYEVASSHMARRTFIGNTYNEVQDPNLISSITGHVNGSQSFARYRDITLDSKKKLVSLMNRKK